jgi:hypothetical protein
MKNPPFRYNTLTALAFLTLATAAPAGATIQVLDYYHMGEADTPAYLLVDSAGQETMKAGDSTVMSGDVSPVAAKRGSTKYRHFNGATVAYNGTPLLLGTLDCGIEAWVRPSSVTGGGCIVYNGKPGRDGFGIFQNNGQIQAQVGQTTFSSGVPLVSGKWCHVALVVSSQRVATLYVDGRNQGSSRLVTPIAPGSQFAVGGSPDFSNKQPFAGDVDEVRAFRFQPGGFTPGDLLVNLPRIYLKAEDTLTFPDQRPGEPGTPVELDIENPGLGTLHLSSMTVEGANAADFVIQPGFTPGTEVGVDKGHVEKLVFTPGGLGQRSAVLKIASDDPDRPLVTLPLSGQGVQLPRIELSNSSGSALGSGGDPQDFSHRDEHGNSLPLSFTIRNTGNTDLSGLGISIAGTNAEEFQAMLTGANTLGPDGKAGVTVSFASAKGGVRRAVLVIGSNDPQAPKFKIPLTATGTGQEIGITVDAGEEELVSGRLVLPDPISDDAGSQSFAKEPAGLSGVTAVSVSYGHGLVLKSDRTVVAWGGDLQDESLVPAGLHDVVAVAAGVTHSLALKADGTVVAWGADDEGQASVPDGLSGVVAIAAGNLYSLALKADGTVVSWGAAPAQPAGLSGVVAISAGYDHVIALKNDATVVEWGDSFAAPPAGLGPVIAIAADNYGGGALTRDGKLVQWGDFIDAAHPMVTAVSDVKSLEAALAGTLVLKNDCTMFLSGVFGPYPYAETLRGVKAASGGNGIPVAVTDPVVDFGSQVVNGAGKVKIFTIRNSGQAPLTISAVSLSGGAGFHLSGPLPKIVPAGGAGTFAVLFNPAADGDQQGDLTVLSDDSDEPVFSARLVATAMNTPLNAWRKHHFGTAANEGEAADLADPNGNGVTNLLEYALGGDPKGGGPVRLPKYDVNGSGTLSLSFTHDANLTDVVLTVQVAGSPGGPWMDLAGSTGGQPFQALRSGVDFTEDADGNVRVSDFPGKGTVPPRFMRLKVTGP